MVKFRVQQQSKKEIDFLPRLSVPARRALQNNGIKTLQDLAKYTETEILQFHGIGKTAIPVLQKALRQKGIDFRISV
jgi:DNA-directed RNA polymerase alpha subunit